MHAVMRLYEALTKVFYGRAIDLGCTGALSKAFEEFLNLKHRFEQVMAHSSNGARVWKRLSLQGYECKAFSRQLPATEVFPSESAIERVLRTVWPSRLEDDSASAPPLPPAVSVAQAAPPPPPQAGRSQGAGASAAKAKQAPRNKKTSSASAKLVNATEPSAASTVGGGDKTGSASKKRNAVREETAHQANRFVELSCFLFKLFHVVAFQMRCKDPANTTLKDFGMNCRNFGARWCMLMPRKCLREPGTGVMGSDQSPS